MTLSDWQVKTPTVKPGEFSFDGLSEDVNDTAPVRVTILQNGKITGWDDGILGFERESFWFSGRSMSFRIGAQDIENASFLAPTVSWHATEQLRVYGLPIKHPTRRILLRIEPFSQNKERQGQLEKWLGDRMVALKRFGGLGIESQYPPLAPRPGIISMRRTVVLEFYILMTLLVAFVVAFSWFVISKQFLFLPFIAFVPPLLRPLSSRVEGVENRWRLREFREDEGGPSLPR